MAGLKATDWVGEYYLAVRTEYGSKVHLTPKSPGSGEIGRTLCGEAWASKTSRPMRRSKWCAVCLGSRRLEVFR